MERDRTTRSGASRKRLTVHDVAQRAGVSIGTVSRVVNNVPGVGAAVAQRVRNAMEELGWSPNIAAQNIRSSASQMIGFIFSDIRNQLYAAMTKGAEDVLAPRGYLLVSSSTDGLPERERALIELFKRRGADGLILTLAEEDNPMVHKAIVKAGIPFVTLERELKGEATSIGADHYSGTLKAAQYLIGLGHRRIAVITGGRGTLVNRDRLRALQDELSAHGLTLDTELLKMDNFEAEYGYRQTQNLLNLKEPPTALLCLGVRLLPGVIAALQNMGKSFPEDISLICSNDTDLSQLVTPPITAIRYDAMELGRLAAESLLEQITGNDPANRPGRLEIPTELVLRGSCRALV